MNTDVKCAIVVLGASGDLARRKLIPALQKLYQNGSLSDSCIIVGSGRTPYDDEGFRARFDNLTPDFARLLHYHTGVSGLRRFIADKGPYNHIVAFMALPPVAYGPSARALAREGFGDETSLVIEKPFGYDYQSARELDSEISSYFPESRVFRIDHYLAKEAVQNILVFRFANSIFYPIWNSRYIESIQINAFETDGVGQRSGYFDKTGIIRDMVQNHLMQLLLLMTMEAPVSLDADEIRLQKKSVLKALEFVRCCRFQYHGYRDEPGVDAQSTTETFAAMQLRINNFRWTGMPVFIRVGKALDRKGTEIGIRFKALPRLLFNQGGDIAPNTIVFKIQPAAGIVMDISSKQPGADIDVASTNMAFCYRDSFSQEIPEAYQKLLLDALRGDHTLFVSAEENELSWQKLQPHLDAGEVSFYERGRVPDPCWDISWIDFTRYAHLCG
jgi:glucose-6-phosphate 1-dehydrogenase